jgi:hypothetical protein
MSRTLQVPHVIVGDYTMGLCNVLPSTRPCAYYTMLREPRERLASSYLHCKYEPDDQLCMSHVLQARNATFPEWVRHQGNYLFRQLMFDLSRALSVEEQYDMYVTPSPCVNSDVLVNIGFFCAHSLLQCECNSY